MDVPQSQPGPLAAGYLVPLGEPNHGHDAISEKPPMASETPLSIRKAVPADLPSLVDLWDATVASLREKGVDQWQEPARTSAFEADVNTGACWIVVAAPPQPAPHTGPPAAGADVVATITVEAHARPQGPRAPWSTAQNGGLHVRSLIVHPSLRGRGLGAALLLWAERRARALGRTVLRLATWTGNDGLRRYYLGQGFRLVAVVEDMRIGAFFEREVPDEGAADGNGRSASLVLAELQSPQLVEVCSDACLLCAVKRLHEKLAVEEPGRC